MVNYVSATKFLCGAIPLQLYGKDIGKKYIRNNPENFHILYFRRMRIFRINFLAHPQADFSTGGHIAKDHKVLYVKINIRYVDCFGC